MDLFSNIKIETNNKTCKTCIHRIRVECGSKTIQYCSVTSSNRTHNGLKKITIKTKACYKYKN